MKSPRVPLVLTLVNLALLAWQAMRLPEARAGDEARVLRARGLEIVDAEGRMRAQIKVEPANPTYRWPDGSRTGYPETVIFRLATADGKPRVKLTTSEEGSGLMLLGSTDATSAILTAQGASTSLRLRNRDGLEKTLSP
jgi:hypothetical protein